jgi:hypothetical protein
MVLSRYTAEVVKAVTNPFSGLPAQKRGNYGGMPDVADVKDACEQEAARLERVQSLGRRQPLRIGGPPVLRTGHELAQLFCPEGFKGWEKYLQLHKETRGEQSYFETRVCKDGNSRHGLWVPWSWHDDMAAPRKTFSKFTEEQLRKMYPPQPAAADDGVPFE